MEIGLSVCRQKCWAFVERNITTPSKPPRCSILFSRGGGEKRPLTRPSSSSSGAGSGQDLIVNRLCIRRSRREEDRGIMIPVGRSRSAARTRMCASTSGTSAGRRSCTPRTISSSPNAVLPLVLGGAKTSPRADAEYWLKLIQSFGGGDSSFVVRPHRSKSIPST